MMTYQPQMTWTRDTRAKVWRATHNGFHFIMYQDNFGIRKWRIRVYRNANQSVYSNGCIAVSGTHNLKEFAQKWADNFDYDTYLDKAIPEQIRNVRNAAVSLQGAIERLSRLQHDAGESGFKFPGHMTDSLHHMIIELEEELESGQ